MGKKIAQIILAALIVALVWVIYVQIDTPITFERDRDARKAKVIERIKDIRAAERAFNKKYQRFTADFDSLINFVLYDSIEGERKIFDDYDSVNLALLKKAGKKNVEKFTVAVIDTIFSPRKLTEEEVRNLRYIPWTNNQTEFILEAGKLETESKLVIPVVECRAPYIAFLDTVKYRQEVINYVDEETNNYNRYAGVKFGSMEGGNNEAGNWE